MIDNQTYSQMVKDQQSKRFAEIDQDLFKTQAITDTHEVYNTIKKSRDYQSL